MTRKLLALAASILPIAAAASTQWTLQDKTYDVDTLYHALVGPGTTTTSLKLSGPYNLRVFYSTIDLTNPNIELRTVTASDSKLAAGQSLLGMVKIHETEDCRYVTGVNADFFGNSKPIGTTVVDGDYFYAINNGWSHWAIDDNRVPVVADMTFSATATHGADSHELTAINAARGENNLILFNTKYGANTATNSYGNEVTATLTGGKLAPGQTAELTVGCEPSAAGSMAIPSGGYVLSGHGTASTFVKSLHQGDKVTVTASLLVDGQSFNARQVAGGCPLILSGGQVLDTQTALDHLTSLNPRTAIGYDSTRTKVVILVVDGRTSISQGCVSRVLADIMKNAGCTEAMNFDGGGSSTLYTNFMGDDGAGVVNSPSDGTPRSVVDAVFAVSATPADYDVASITFEDPAIVLPRYGIYRPALHLFNRYGVWIGTTTDGFELSCDAALGETDGSRLLVTGSGCHALTANYNGLTATIPVTVGTANPEFRRSTVLVDGTWDYAVEVTSLVGTTTMTIDNRALTWTSDNPAIATVDASGTVHGVADGTTTVRGRVGDLSDEIAVTVERPTAEWMTLDAMTDPDAWTVTGSNLSGISTKASADGQGLDITFTRSGSRSPALVLTRDLRAWSRPTALEMTINPGKSGLSLLSVTYQLDGGRNAVTKESLDLTPDVDNTVLVNWGDYFDTTSPDSYPLTISRVHLTVGGATGETYTVRIGQLKNIYGTYTPPSGISDLRLSVDEAAEPVYYNLQGIRVDHPERGRLYIERRGCRGRKVVF